MDRGDARGHVDALVVHDGNSTVSEVPFLPLQSHAGLQARSQDPLQMGGPANPLPGRADCLAAAQSQAVASQGWRLLSTQNYRGRSRDHRGRYMYRYHRSRGPVCSVLVVVCLTVGLKLLPGISW